MTLISESDRTTIRERFGELIHPLTFLVFTSEDDCRYCEHTRALIEELASLDERISVRTIDAAADPALVAQYGIDKFPAIAVLGLLPGSEPSDDPGAAPVQQDTGIRFYGIPAGYEMLTLIEDAIAVSRRDPGLSGEMQAWLATLDHPVHLQVFVTPTCPYCPRAVVLAHRLALASPHIRADMVEATEFPDLAERYDVYGVPRTVINETVAVEGAVPEAHLLEHLRESVAA
ncbi:MAG TPA: thioredoxin family protein [Chloroflexota bacterium]|jgi:glutaredoxin-like protein|nr:thioredoxin family protein [Chloroflexota bacterium]